MKQVYKINHINDDGTQIDEFKSLPMYSMLSAIEIARQWKRKRPNATFWVDTYYRYLFGDVWSSSTLLNNKVVEFPKTIKYRHVENFVRRRIFSDLPNDESNNQFSILMSALMSATYRFTSHQKITNGKRSDSLKVTAIHFYQSYELKPWKKLPITEQFKAYIFVEIFIRNTIEPLLKLDNQ